MMPMSLRRKSRRMEKVEILYRTARAQNDSINTQEQQRSRLRDVGRAERMARTVEEGAPQDQRIEGQLDE